MTVYHGKRNHVPVTTDYNINVTPHPSFFHQIGEDLITLGCIQYRLTNENPDRASIEASYDITSDSVKSRITHEDRILAHEVKSHFGKKLMMLTLLGTQLSSFRKDLNVLINTDFSKNDYSYPDKFIGMAYKLPYFYQYDKELANIFGGAHRKINGDARFPEEKSKLTFINKIRNHLKADSTFEYWFSDEKDNRILLKVDCNNPLLPVFDLMIKEPISVSGTFATRYREELQFYEVRNWQFDI